MVDNHLHHGNALGIDERSITWPRVLDVNDRALRHVVTGLGARADGVTRQASFDITPASEVMVILSLATSLADLRARLGRIVVGRTTSGGWVTAEDLGVAGAMAALLRDALAPNLLRTTEGTPVLVHTGPFGNIATGCSSVVADLVAARGGGYVLTEAGFGADMGAERLFDLKCAVSGLVPRAAVVVVTVRALKAHCGRYHLVAGRDLPEAMRARSVQDVRAGAANLLRHLEIVRGFGVEPVVAVNVFPTDHDSEVAEVVRIATGAGVRAVPVNPVEAGGAGCLELADALADACAAASPVLRPLYQADDDLRTKIGKVAAMYGADGVDYAPAASRLIDAYEEGGYGALAVLVAKTPLSLSAGACPCARCGWPPARATSTPCAGPCPPCPACPATPPPRKWTWTCPPARSWACAEGAAAAPARAGERRPQLPAGVDRAPPEPGRDLRLTGAGNPAARPSTPARSGAPRLGPGAPAGGYRSRSSRATRCRLLICSTLSTRLRYLGWSRKPVVIHTRTISRAIAEPMILPPRHSTLESVCSRASRAQKGSWHTTAVSPRTRLAIRAEP